MDRANRNRLKQRLQEKKFDATFRHGMGISVFQQNASPFNSTRLAGQYAMHLPVSRQWILSAGGSLSYIFTQFSSEDLLIENVADPVYERYLGGDYNFNYLGFSGGMSLYSERFIMSYAFQNLYVNHGDDTSQDFFQTYESQLHHLSMFYTAEVNAEMQLQLGVNASIGSLANDRTQGSLKAIYKERLGISTAYDSNDILIPGVFAFISRNFRVNYLADIPLESSIGENQISHEISLQFLIKPGASPTPYFY